MLKNSKKFSKQAGDTLIEVLFAVTVFSLVVVLSLSLMNQGTATSIRSLQITMVRQEIDNQAETLRFLNSSYATNYHSGFVPQAGTPAEEYYKIVTQARADRLAGKTSASNFHDSDTTCTAAPTNSFVLNTKTGQYQKNDSNNYKQADGFSQVEYSDTGAISAAKGIWVEALRSNPANGTAYIDFHIRACWYSPGQEPPMKIGTIVRLYEPAY